MAGVDYDDNDDGGARQGVPVDCLRKDLHVHEKQEDMNTFRAGVTLGIEFAKEDLREGMQNVRKVILNKEDDHLFKSLALAEIVQGFAPRHERVRSATNEDLGRRASRLHDRCAKWFPSLVKNVSKDSFKKLFKIFSDDVLAMTDIERYGEDNRKFRLVASKAALQRRGGQGRGLTDTDEDLAQRYGDRIYWCSQKTGDPLACPFMSNWAVEHMTENERHECLEVLS